MSRALKESISPQLRWAVWERDNFTCHYCGTRKMLAVDHKIPESKGGPTTQENLLTACVRCNSRKGAKSYEKFTEELKAVPGELDVVTIPVVLRNGKRGYTAKVCNSLTIGESELWLSTQSKRGGVISERQKRIGQFLVRRFGSQLARRLGDA